MYTYDTVSEALNDLRRRGYSIDFNLQYDGVICREPLLSLQPNEFTITEVYRFEGPSDPADEAVVYAIESSRGEKGILVDGFGPSSDTASEAMLMKLAVRR